ncbi:MAG: SRPBCC family protein [Pyrinomonadaceae bacterium]|nr:SRPBCC family protein [Pyrinomonadaceae bacterium]
MKKVLLGIVGVLAILLIAFGALTMLAPTEFAVEREVVIDKPKAEVFEYVKSLKNQQNWTVWAKKDPKSKYTYTGDDGEVGSIVAWDSEHPEVGAGEQEIKKIVDGERIDVELRFKRPFESTSAAHTITEAVGDDKTKVKWGFSGSMPRPMNVMLLITDLEGTAGKEFEEGLGNLKTLLESQSTPAQEEKPEEDGDEADPASKEKGSSEK